jgi:hypothetical protein
LWGTIHPFQEQTKLAAADIGFCQLQGEEYKGGQVNTLTTEAY